VDDILQQPEWLRVILASIGDAVITTDTKGRVTHLAASVDDATWLHHFKQGDYSHWFREGIHDKVLADEAEQIEKAASISTLQTRQEIKELIERYYTLPPAASTPMPGPTAEVKASR
jgi:hypothetical protein